MLTAVGIPLAAEADGVEAIDGAVVMVVGWPVL
jgi:hypothetical protein